MASVGVNPPKTPVTTASNGVASATVPNVCKMPGPPAPFVPTPLPNIGRSGLDPKGFSRSVEIEGHAVAIRGASFGSQGDMASKGSGGGLVSANTHGPAKFIGPGSMNVKIEGKNVQLLGDPMLNNCGPSGSPANAATMAGVVQGASAPGTALQPCSGHEPGGEPYFPEATEPFKDRRNALARNHGPGGQHEFDAAKHNEPDILRLEGTLNRETSGKPRRSALSGKDLSQQVRHTCKHCGAPLAGEIEHAIEDKEGRRHAVEAKSGEDFYPAKDPQESIRNRNQMIRYKELATNNGYGLVYKLPTGHTKAKQQILALARTLKLPNGQPSIIFI